MAHRWILTILLGVGVFVACGDPKVETDDQASAVVLTDIHGVEELQARFNQDAGTPRLILLVSPT